MLERERERERERELFQKQNYYHFPFDNWFYLFMWNLYCGFQLAQLVKSLIIE